MKPRNEHLDLMYRWIRYVNKFSLADILYKNDIRHIAIYGGGVLGTILYEHLKGTEIEIKYIVDKNRYVEFPYMDEVNIIQPDKADLLMSLDAIIVTVDFLRVEESLKSYVKCLSLENLIIDLDELNLFQDVTRYIKDNGANLIFADMTFPLSYLKNPTNAERYFRHTQGNAYTVFNDYLEGLIPYYDDLENCSIEYIRNIFLEVHNSLSIIEKEGIEYVKDINSQYCNIINGCRLTTNVPDIYQSSIHLFGNCTVLGLFAEDQYTIGSFLQRRLNGMSGDTKYRVVNRANWMNYQKSLLQILHTPIKSGDYVILINQGMQRFKLYVNENENMNFIDLVPAFDRPHGFGEIFFDNYHTNHRGYKLIADYIYNFLLQQIENNKNMPIKDINCFNSVISGLKQQKRIEAQRSSGESVDLVDLDTYLRFLDENRIEGADNKVIGSVVVNCNPFSYGHRYLVDEALKQCDYLYVFVVEEDKSFFPFKDRIECVRRGLSDLDNVKVLPSGQFIISTRTFPEYFIKDSFKDTIDASFDVKLFGTKIAPKLSITKRFVGNEPNCIITRQYNQQLIDYLSLYGIEIKEISRIEKDGVAVSASRVRALLEKEDWLAIEKLVPPTTLLYLRNFVRG